MSILVHTYSGFLPEELYKIIKFIEIVYGKNTNQ